MSAFANIFSQPSFCSEAAERSLGISKQGRNRVDMKIRVDMIIELLGFWVCRGVRPENVHWAR